MTPPTTSGWPSRPRSVPVDIVHATCRFLTFPVFTLVSGLNRVEPRSPPGCGHCADAGPLAAAGACPAANAPAAPATPNPVAAVPATASASQMASLPRSRLSVMGDLIGCNRLPDRVLPPATDADRRRTG